MGWSWSCVLVFAVVLLATVTGCGSDDGESALAPESAIARLGLSNDDAARYAIESLASGYAPVHVAAGTFKALSDESRVQLVRGLGAWARTYFDSAEFDRAYAALRDGRRPAAAEYDETVDEAVQRWIEDGLAEVEESRENVLPLMPEESRPEMEKGLDSMAAMYRDPEMIEMQRQTIEQQRAIERQSYESSLVAWQQDFPESPAPLIARRLRAFLDTCADVDFDADLTEAYGTLRFEDSDYESRSSEWKLCYRAGEPTVTAARSFALEWLAALE